MFDKNFAEKECLLSLKLPFRSIKFHPDEELVLFFLCILITLLSIKQRYKLIYMQSNKIHKVFLMSEFFAAHMLARHISDLTSPFSGAFLTSCIRRFGMW